MAGLEDLGIPGGDYLRESLTNCSDPLAAIEEFQTENGILLPSLRPALPFLDLFEIKRLDFHNSVLEELSENLTNRIAELANSEQKNRFTILESLLEKCFPVIRVKNLRPVVMSILKHLPKIDDKYLTKILEDKELYSEAAVEVKRQIWQENQALFGDEVSPLLSQYIKDKESSLFNHEHSSLTFFLPSPRTRRQSDIVQKLAEMVGRNVKLYDMVLQFLRTLFLRTRNAHYCTLRAELLMALHDQEINEICSVDPCHKFTWCVDACIRDKFIDSKRSRELQGFLDGIKKGQEFVLGDLSMILCDPYALNTIALSMMKTLHHCVNNDILPRDNIDVVLLTRMMALGLGAWDMIDSQLFREPKLDVNIIIKFLPMITSMMVEDQMRSFTGRPVEEYVHNLKIPADTYILFIKDNSIASMIAMYYTLQVSRNRDKVAVLQILPSLVHSENDRAYEDTFLHCLIAYLLSMGDDFSYDDFCVCVLDDFLLPSISKENVLRHLLRLVWYIHHKLPGARLEALLEGIAPNNEHSEAVHTMYALLVDKVKNYQPQDPVLPPEELDSPLVCVPTPAPL
ncbi:negative elongation factor B-like [Mytilus californianus]|uniref:negative elongation factor B-like n=1 Tax=Mytilus californianus TaxID=6549 RepID=UPI002246C225|nr:negative elongation factor B-like [Mytilus californianus]